MNDKEAGIIKIINALKEKGAFYIFENNEDFVDTRTDWDELADISKDLYYALIEIKSLILEGT